jgi:glycine/sarcosine N-methyltransferase
MAIKHQNNHSFYSSIAKAYDYIFPLKKPAFEFTVNQINKKSKLLDVGCATGSMSIALSPYCGKIDAFDLDNEMIKIAQQKARKQDNINFYYGNMAQLIDQSQNSNYDLVFCYGNTLVHLLSIEDISNFLKQVYEILKPNGKLALQILNYDYIIDNKITELPTIENDHIRFDRTYQFNSDNRLIDFNTKLTIKKNNEAINNTTRLFSIRPLEIKSQLSNQGFSDINMYSSYKKAKLSNTELPLIITATKS